jgi:hypothetical protein
VIVRGSTVSLTGLQFEEGGMVPLLQALKKEMAINHNKNNLPGIEGKCNTRLADNRMGPAKSGPICFKNLLLYVISAICYFSGNSAYAIIIGYAVHYRLPAFSAQTMAIIGTRLSERNTRQKGNNCYYSNAKQDNSFSHF